MEEKAEELKAMAVIKMKLQLMETKWKRSPRRSFIIWITYGYNERSI